MYGIWPFSILHYGALCGIHRSRDSWRRIWQMEVHTFLAGCQRGKALVSYSILHFTRSHNLCVIPPGWTRHTYKGINSYPAAIFHQINVTRTKGTVRKHYLCLNLPFFTHSQISCPKFKKINNDSKTDSVLGFDQCKYFLKFYKNNFTTLICCFLWL